MYPESFKNDLIAQLKNPGRGHGFFSMSMLSNALEAKYANSLTKFTALFACKGSANLNHFKFFLQHLQPSVRLYIPLGLGGNHATALIVDIDNNHHSDILFFNSLGNSNAGHYYTEAQAFINAVREQFPKKNDYYINKKFQQLSNGDIFCGDWSFWFFEEAAKKNRLSLEEISLYFERMKSTPTPQSLRAHHIELLECYFASQEKEKAYQEIVSKEKLNTYLEQYQTKFDELLSQLEATCDLLEKKVKHDSTYETVAWSMRVLYKTLKQEMGAFVDKPSSSQFLQCYEACAQAMSIAETQAVQHRGWHAVTPIIKGILGVLAALVILPALIVETTSKHGYVQTFFVKPPTTTSEKMASIKKKFNEMNLIHQNI